MPQTSTTLITFIADKPSRAETPSDTIAAFVALARAMPDVSDFEATASNGLPPVTRVCSRALGEPLLLSVDRQWGISIEAPGGSATARRIDFSTDGAEALANALLAAMAVLRIPIERTQRRRR